MNPKWRIESSQGAPGTGTVVSGRNYEDVEEKERRSRDEPPYLGSGLDRADLSKAEFKMQSAKFIFNRY
jgi:hypothetical protein